MNTPESPEDAEIENSKDKSKWGGARPGAGRPAGKMNESTKQRIAIKNAFQDRVAKNADRLFNAQFNLAVGEQYLMHKYTVGTGAKQRTVVDVVDDPEIIKAFINDELNEYGGEEWYYLSTKPANGMALDSLLNRSFGKADEKLDMTTNGDNIGVTLSADQAAQLIRARANRSNL